MSFDQDQFAPYNPALPGNQNFQAASRLSGSKAILFFRSFAISIPPTFGLRDFTSFQNSVIGTTLYVRGDDVINFNMPLLPPELALSFGERYALVRVPADATSGFKFLNFMAEEIMAQENNVRGRLGKELLSMAIVASKMPSNGGDLAIVIEVHRPWETPSYFEENPLTNYQPGISFYASIGNWFNVTGGSNIIADNAVLFGFPMFLLAMDAQHTGRPFESLAIVNEQNGIGWLTDVPREEGWLGTIHPYWAWKNTNRSLVGTDLTTVIHRIVGTVAYDTGSYARFSVGTRIGRNSISRTYNPTTGKWVGNLDVAASINSFFIRDCFLDSGTLFAGPNVLADGVYYKNNIQVDLVIPTWGATLGKAIKWEYDYYAIFEAVWVIVLPNYRCYSLGPSNLGLLFCGPPIAAQFQMRSGTYEHIRSFNNNSIFLGFLYSNPILV